MFYCCYIVFIFYKKNVSNLLRLRFRGILAKASVTLRDAERGKAYHLKRVNAHAKRRELSTSVLGDCCQIPQLSNNKNQKWTFFNLKV